MKRLWCALVLLIASISMSACGAGRVLGPTVTPSLTNTLTPTETPTSVPTPTATPTPTSIPPTSTPTPIPQPVSVISLNNIEKMVELGQLGSGSPYSVHAAWSPNGKLLATGSSKGVYLYNVQTSERVMFIDYDSSVTSVSFSIDGETLASGLENGMVKLWDVATGRELQTIGEQSEAISILAFSSDGKTLASGTENRIVVWDVSNGHRIYTVTMPADDQAMALSPDGKLLASGGCGEWNKYLKNDCLAGRIRLWDMATGLEVSTISGHTKQIWLVVFSPDGTMLASTAACCVRNIMIWDISSGRLLSTLRGHPESGAVNGLVFSPDGKKLASRGKNAKVWNVGDGSELHSLTEHSEFVTFMTFSPDGTTLATGENDGIVRLWEVASGQEQSEITVDAVVGHTRGVNSMVFSQDGKTLISSAQDKTVRFWDIATGTQLHVLKNDKYIDDVDLSPDEQLLASTVNDTVVLWDLGSGSKLRTLSGSYIRCGICNVSDVAFSPDGRLVASGNVFRTYIWDTYSGNELYALRRDGGDSGMGTVAFSPDGRLVAGGGHALSIWSTTSGEEIYTLINKTTGDWFTSYVNDIAFSTNGRFLASAGGLDSSKLHIWNVSSGQELRTFVGHTIRVNSVAFSPDSNVLASAAIDGVRLWNVANGQELRTLLPIPGDKVIAFSPDGKLLAIGMLDGTVRLWGVK